MSAFEYIVVGLLFEIVALVFLAYTIKPLTKLAFYEKTKYSDDELEKIKKDELNRQRAKWASIPILLTGIVIQILGITFQQLEIYQLLDPIWEEITNIKAHLEI